MTFPKIELHVHLEGTVRPRTLLQIARRNALPLPADTEEELAELYRYRDFTQFLAVWAMTTKVLQREADFRQVVAHGAVYVEGIFTPAEPVLGLGIVARRRSRRSASSVRSRSPATGGWRRSRMPANGPALGGPALARIARDYGVLA